MVIFYPLNHNIFTKALFWKQNICTLVILMIKFEGTKIINQSDIFIPSLNH